MNHDEFDFFGSAHAAAGGAATAASAAGSQQRRTRRKRWLRQWLCAFDLCWWGIEKIS